MVAVSQQGAPHSVVRVNQVEVGGLRVAYERAGAGSPVVLLHGFVGDAAATWQDQIEALSGEFTVVAWDAPGMGRSSDPPESFRMADYADCLSAFVSALGLGRPHVVGLSFGGALALQLCRRHPAVPRTLTLAGGYAGWSGSLGEAAAEQRLRRCLELSDTRPEEFAAAMIPTMFSPSAPAERVEAFAANMLGFSAAGFRTMARALAEADLRDGLGRVEVATLLMHGDQDQRAPLEVAQALHASIPASKLVVMPGVGHVSPVEAPELFNRELLEFLRTTEG